MNLVINTRRRLEQSYGDEPARKDQGPLGSEEAASQQAAKERVIVQLRSDYDQLKARWDGYPGYDGCGDWSPLRSSSRERMSCSSKTALPRARIASGNSGDQLAVNG